MTNPNSNHEDVISDVEIFTPTPEERARLALNSAMKEEATEITTKFLALVKNKLTLLDTVFRNVEILNQDLFNPANFEQASYKDKVKLLQIHLNALNTLEIPLKDQEETVKQINTQINAIFCENKQMAALPRDSRNKIKAALVEMLKNNFVEDKEE